MDSDRNDDSTADPTIVADTGTTSGAEQLADLLDVAASHGYSVEFDVADEGADLDALACPSCAEANPSSKFERAWRHRLEGASDPADMLLVSALSCPRCGARGVFVAPFGPAASERQAAVVRGLPEPERDTPLSPD